MSRRAVTDALTRIEFAAELLDDPQAEAWGRAAWAVRNLEGDVAELRQSGKLAKVRGIGEAAIEAIDAVLAQEKPSVLATMEARLPPGLFAIRTIKGLGPKKVKQLWEQLSITTLGELEYACRENRLVGLSGFGDKTQAKVLAELERLRSLAGALRRDQARALLDPIERELLSVDEVVQVEVVGDFGRGEEIVRELAVLVESDDEGQALAAIERAKPRERAVALHLADAETFAAKLVWLTSSSGHRAALSDRARERGLCFDADGLAQDGDGAPLACEIEEDVYRALGLVPTERERRQDGVPLVNQGKAVPALVCREDLVGALHNHTLASDGSATLEQMRVAARDRGLRYLGISEHSESAFYARGLDAERLLTQLTEIDALNVDPDGCVLLTGVESDIRQDGTLDYPDDVLGELDVVVASVHRRHGQSGSEMTRRMVAAASNALTDIVGHPTGRLLLGRAASELDIGAFLDACAVNRTAVELNANPHRLDLNEVHLAMAKERGLLVSIAADAHSTSELDNLDYGVTIARRAGLTALDVLNTRTLDELKTWIRERRSS